MKFPALLLGFALWCAISPASAQQRPVDASICTQALVNGRETFKFSSFFSSDVQIEQWLRTLDEGGARRATDLGMDVSVIDLETGFPVNLKGNFSHDDYNAWKKVVEKSSKYRLRLVNSIESQSSTVATSHSTFIDCLKIFAASSGAKLSRFETMEFRNYNETTGRVELHLALRDNVQGGLTVNGLQLKPDPGLKLAEPKKVPGSIHSSKPISIELIVDPKVTNVEGMRVRVLTREGEHSVFCLTCFPVRWVWTYAENQTGATEVSRDLAIPIASRNHATVHVWGGFLAVFTGTGPRAKGKVTMYRPSQPEEDITTWSEIDSPRWSESFRGQFQTYQYAYKFPQVSLVMHEYLRSLNQLPLGEYRIRSTFEVLPYTNGRTDAHRVAHPTFALYQRPVPIYVEHQEACKLHKMREMIPSEVWKLIEPPKLSKSCN